ncbi:MAG: Ldh family oxidoreductase [Comamonadaceae bacterium]|nr:Ldh family oxidoreductase [Comamonadaceae bacterium]
MTDLSVSHTQIAAFITATMKAVGLPEDDARTVGDLMAEADLQGSDGHGVIRVPVYIRRILGGAVNVKPQIKVVEERAATALIDGDNGMGHLVMKRAAELAIEKARRCGVAWVGSRYSNHAGPASLYARMPLAHDMVSLYFAVGNANHLPPWGGLDMLLSTNPIAVAMPTEKEAPVVLDMATTVAAYGKVKSKAMLGQMMPEGWMIDRQGQPLLDPNRREEGFLLPIGGYKGYGLSMVFGLLAGTLNGAAMGTEVVDFNNDDTSVTNTGQAICVIDPAAFGDVGAFKRRVDKLVQEIHASERMPGHERIWVPGEQSHLKREKHLHHGISVPASLVRELDAVAAQLGVPNLANTTH